MPSVSSTTRKAPATKHHATIKFSALEERLIGLLRDASERSEPALSTPELVGLYWPGQEPPLNARTIVVGRLRGIAAKAERARLPWRVRKTKRAGPNPQSFWLVKG